MEIALWNGSKSNISLVDQNTDMAVYLGPSLPLFIL